MDLTDLFSELYDRLPEKQFKSGHARSVFENAERAGRPVAREVLAGTFDVDDAGARLERGELDWDEHFALLLGLDRAFANVHPFIAGFPTTTAELAAIKERYMECGMLGNENSRGQLLPRLGAPGAALARLESAADALRYVVRVPEDDLAKVDLVWIGNQVGDGDAIVHRELAVGCAPMVESYDELEISRAGTSAHPQYRLAPRTDVVEARVQSVLEELDDSGAMIGLLPEATLDDRLVEVWQSVLASTERPADSRLCMVVCGTGPVGAQKGASPPNRAVVLDRVAPHEPLWIQDKRFGFTMDPNQLTDWQLAKALGYEQTAEDIDVSGSTVVVDSLFGRIAITVCEDLARLGKLKAPLEACGVSLILAPVFSKEVRPHYWEDAAGKFYVADGAAVVVCNSLAVPTATGLEPEVDERNQEKWGTALVRSPDSFKLERSERADHVRVLRFPIRVPGEPG